MAIHSYSQPSSSSRISESIPMSIPRRRPREDIYGFPGRCVCGRWLVLKTSRTELNPGRRFYGCEDSENGLYHSFKWWDEAIMEEFQGLRLVIDDIRYARDPTSAPKIETLRCDIRALEKEISVMKKLFEEKKSGGIGSFGMKNAIVVAAGGLVVLFGSVIYFLMP